MMARPSLMKGTGVKEERSGTAIRSASWVFWLIRRAAYPAKPMAPASKSSAASTGTSLAQGLAVMSSKLASRKRAQWARAMSARKIWVVSVSGIGEASGTVVTAGVATLVIGTVLSGL